MEEKSVFRSMLQQKCPKCRKGNLFAFSMFNLSRFLKMHKNCPECGQSFEIEPGFYFGAMYISYAFNTGLTLIIGLTFYNLGIRDMWTYMSTIIGLILLLSPPIFRFSRIIFLYAFGGVKYDKKVVASGQ